MSSIANVAWVRLLVLVTLTAAAAPALAAWPHDPNAGNLPVSTAVDDQIYPTTVSDGAGGAITTWYDHRSGTNYDIYAQRVSAAGLPMWTANGVAICVAASDQTLPTIVSDGAGGAVITWQDLRSGNRDIYAQRVNAAGVTQWTANGVALCTAVNDQQYPNITSDGAAGAIVTWFDARGGATNDIYAQRISAAGVALWTPNGVPLCTSPLDQFSPVIASDQAGGAIVTWWDNRAGNSDIYAQRVNASGTALWAANGVAVCTAVNNQQYPSIASDGLGGAVIAWSDGRNGGETDVYTQRLNSSGGGLWAPNGVAVCTASGNQDNAVVCSDGAGGAIVSWLDLRSGFDYDLYAQRVNASGYVQWAPNGFALSTGLGSQFLQTMMSDGAGGAIVTWMDKRNLSNYDIFAQRVNAAGTALWASNGAALCNALGDQGNPTIASDGAYGAIVCWHDNRNGAGNDIYAQRIDAFGYIGSAEPASAGVRDVPNDQGGKVKVSWTASYLDLPPYNFIDAYWILRSAPPNSVTEARARGARVSADLSVEPEPGVRTFFALPDRATDYAWEFVASEPPLHVPSYSYVAATTGDSLGAGNPRTAFMIMARANGGQYYWYSAPDSGYSVDNIPPSAPAPFTAAYVAGATHLHWGPNSEGDLAGYRLYRGSSSSFVPAPGNLVSAQPDTGFGDVGPAGGWYKLSAIDAHGNESLFAVLGPGGTLAVPVDAALQLSLAPPSPNPSRGEGTTLAFSLPVDARVTLAIFDEQGRRVRALVDGPSPAGRHQPHWDGTDDSGRLLPSGIYFVRLEAMGRSIRTRLALIR
jgi:FlgD Ig-like domain